MYLKVRWDEGRWWLGESQGFHHGVQDSGYFQDDLGPWRASRSCMSAGLSQNGERAASIQARGATISVLDDVEVVWSTVRGLAVAFCKPATHSDTR